MDGGACTADAGDDGDPCGVDTGVLICVGTLLAIGGGGGPGGGGGGGGVAVGLVVAGADALGASLAASSR